MRTLPGAYTVRNSRKKRVRGVFADKPAEFIRKTAEKRKQGKKRGIRDKE